RSRHRLKLSPQDTPAIDFEPSRQLASPEAAMFDFDPRDSDSRDDDRFAPNRDRAERDKDRDDADGRPDREPAEIEEWAHEHDLPYFDDQVHFPDLRIEYEEPDGRWDHRDVEVTTVHYRGGHGAAAAQSGFACYRGSSAR